MSYFYSPTMGGFYHEDLKAVYETAGSWPDDVLPVKDKDYTSLMAGICDGKRVIPGKYGYPKLSEQPKLSQKELIAAADEQRDMLMADASQMLLPYQDAADLGIATEEELERLQALKVYRVQLRRTDTSKAPDIQWPEVPDGMA